MAHYKIMTIIVIIIIIIIIIIVSYVGDALT